MSSTRQPSVRHRSLSVDVEMLRPCLSESSVPRLNEWFLMSA